MHIDIKCFDQFDQASRKGIRVLLPSQGFCPAHPVRQPFADDLVCPEQALAKEQAKVATDVGKQRVKVVEPVLR